MNFLEEKQKLVEKINRIEFLEELVKNQEEDLSSVIKEAEKLKEVYDLFIKTLSYSRESFKSYLENIVNTFLDEIYPNHNDKFLIKFVEKRNQIETEFYLGSLQVKQPFIGTGGGKLSVISLALFLALNLIFSKNSLILLDEVTKMIDSVALEKLSEVLRNFCEKYNKNILIVTHQEPVLYFAHNKLVVTKNSKGIANIRLEE